MTIRKKDSESSSGMIADIMKEIGKKVSKKEKVFILSRRIK